jgi:hypothetical protein
MVRIPGRRNTMPSSMGTPIARKMQDTAMNTAVNIITPAGKAPGKWPPKGTGRNKNCSGNRRTEGSAHFWRVITCVRPMLIL